MSNTSTASYSNGSNSHLHHHIEHSSTLPTSGRVTLPIESGMDEQLPYLLNKIGADAVRNSDGTSLPECANQLGAEIYATYFVGRGDQEWALSHPEHRTQIFLRSQPRPATTPFLASDGSLTIDPMSDYLSIQIEPCTTCDLSKYWQVVDHSINSSTKQNQPYSLSKDEWEIRPAGKDNNGKPRWEVVIPQPKTGHLYSVYFLAWQTWDPTQMYNYITNGWENDPNKVREQPYDVRHSETWEHVKLQFKTWLDTHPEVDVVRFTTFFYHFTLVFNQHYKEKFVDWFGYTASVSQLALETFAQEYGYELTPADFVDEGYYNSPFRLASPQFRDWLDFQNKFVCQRVTEIVEMTHQAGKKAMMFLGDNWIGTEPYGKRFAQTNMDAVVGSVGSAATCRMISDIPGVKYTEGRFLPYFFPDVFCPGGDPVGQAEEFWQCARRAIVRSPLDRIGYGGYLSLAVKFPEFLDRVAEICDEFRSLHERGQGERPANARFKVGIINEWGAIRSWQTHMVAHALWYRQTDPYIGVLESLAGLPFEIEFISFAQVADAGVPSDVRVLINAGDADTAFSGGERWANPALCSALREFVAQGGGLIGIGEPTAHLRPGSASYFQLADIFGLDRERGWTLSTDRYTQLVIDHFITADSKPNSSLSDSTISPTAIDLSKVLHRNLNTAQDIYAIPVRPLNLGNVSIDVVPISPNLQVLQLVAGSIEIATHDYGKGRAVYFGALPYNDYNCRAIMRAIYYAAGEETSLTENYLASDPRVEVAYYPQSKSLFVYNNSANKITTDILAPTGYNILPAITLPARGAKWLDLS